MDEGPYFESRLKDDPAIVIQGIVEEVAKPHLKNASLVCHHWRLRALRKLFSHVKLMLVDYIGMPKEFFSLLTNFVDAMASAHLTRWVESLTIVITQHPCAIDDDPDRDLDITTKLSSGSLDLDFSSQTSRDPWQRIFDRISPRRVTFIAHPYMLSLFLAEPLDYSHEWAFAFRFHILSFSRDTRHTIHERTRGETMNHNGDTQVLKFVGSAPETGCGLYRDRTWDSVLLNEGCFKRANRGDERYFQPLSFLWPLLATEGWNPSNHPSTTFCTCSYVAISPSCHHVSSALLASLPQVDRLEIQLSPSDEPSDGNIPAPIESISREEQEGICDAVMDLMASSRAPTVSVLVKADRSKASNKDAWNDIVTKLHGMAPNTWKLGPDGSLLRINHN